MAQVQLKLSLSSQLSQLLQSKAAAFGLPVTQFVKHLIIREVESTFPVYEASDWLEKKTKSAMDNINQASEMKDKDIDKFFKEL